MDWSKAKNIIIVVLVLTNLFLILMYGGEYVKKYEDDHSVYEYTMNVLSEHDITVKCDIPDEAERMHSLVVSYGEHDEDAIQQLINSSEPLAENRRHTEGYGAAADQFIKQSGYDGEGTKRMTVNISEERVEAVYKNYYEDIPLEVCYMKVIFTDGKISGFERKWMEVVEESSTKTEVMSPLSALLYFMSEVQPEEGTVIENIYMTYWIDSYDLSGNVLYDTALPAWCIEYNGGQRQYVSSSVQ